MWKMASEDENLQTKRNKRETHQRDKGKWSLSQKGDDGKRGEQIRRAGPAAVWGCRAETRLLTLSEEGFYPTLARSGPATKRYLQHHRTHLWWSQHFSEQCCTHVWTLQLRLSLPLTTRALGIQVFLSDSVFYQKKCPTNPITLFSFEQNWFSLFVFFLCP